MHSTEKIENGFFNKLNLPENKRNFEHKTLSKVFEHLFELVQFSDYDHKESRRIFK